jgi:phosphoribosylanthranilate isomerase
LTGAQAVDVSSGVERSPGVKDVALIRRFLQAVKPAKQI